MARNPDAIIVGAGPAGLACAAMMKAQGLDVVVLEKADQVGAVWRRHYDRLHLHTDRKHSGLAGFPMPATYPLYPSRAQVVEYFERYAAHFDVKPIFGAAVSKIGRDSELNFGLWRVETADDAMTAPIVVVATGIADSPHRPSWPGLRDYSGAVIHSSEYRNPAPFVGQRVLVIGFGNSGGEIALDLAEAGVDVVMAIRGPVQIIPRDLLGLPIMSWAIFYRRLPARLVDLLNRPVLRMALGDFEKLGLRRDAKGPRQMVEEDGRVPLIDIGTLARIRDGSIRISGGIDRFTSDGVVSFNGKPERIDAVILATGFRPDLRRLMPDIDGVFDRHGMPRVTGQASAAPGLYFCGQITVSTGQLREIGIEAQRIAADAKAYLMRSAQPD